MKKYWLIFKNNISRNIIYRFRVLVWFLVNMMLILVFPFIWLAAYGDQQTLANFDKTSLVSYFIALAIVNIIVIVHVEEAVIGEIKDGEISKNLVKPLPYFWDKFFGVLSYRSTNILFFIPISILAIIIFNQYLFIPHSFLTWIYFLISLILSLLLSFLSTYFIGLFAFWLEDASSLQSIYWISFSIFSGQFAPLDFFPKILQQIAVWLPFKYIVYFPVNLYLEKLDNWEILKEFTIQFSWIIIIGLLCLVLWKRGLKKYTAVGL